MEAEKGPEDLFCLVVLLLLECARAQGMTDACIMLTCHRESEDVRRRKQEKVGKKSKENLLNTAQ